MIPGILAELCSRFSAAARQRGERYFRQGRVTLKNVGGQEVDASVRGTHWYAVNLRRARPGASWTLYCTCPAYDREVACKHLYAVLCALEYDGSDVRPNERRSRKSARGATTRAVLASPREPTLADLERELHELVTGIERAVGKLDDGNDGSDSDGEDNDDEHHEHGDDDAPTAVEVLPAPTGPSDADVNGWRERLRQLRLASRDSIPVVGRPARLRYWLAVDDARELGRAVVRPAIERAYKRGGWSEPRPFDLDPREDERLDAVDRRIVEMLRGARESLGSYGFGGFPITDALQPVLLPELARSGRLYLSRARTRTIEAEPLAWDEQGPWSFGITITRVRSTRRTALCGFLARGAERIDLADPIVVYAGGMLVRGDRVAAVDWRGAWRAVPVLRASRSIEVPTEREAELFDAAAALAGEPLLDAPEVVRTLSGPPTPRLIVDAPGRTAGASLDGRIEFAYGAVRVGARAAERLRRIDHELVRLERDDPAEQAALEAFRAAGGVLDLVARDGRDGVVDARSFPALVEALCSAGWEVEAQGRPCRSGGSFALSVRSGIDWFDLKGELAFGPASADLPELLRAAREGRRFVPLSDGSQGLLPEAWLAGWDLAAIGIEQGDGSLRFASTRAWLLDALLAERAVDVDRAFARARDALRRWERPTPLREPKGFRGTLRPYQREGLGWLAFLRELGFGGCLADDMGLGKTVQVLALLVSRAREERRPSLVVAPKSVVHNWRSEAERFAPGLRVLAHVGLERERDMGAIEGHDLVLTTYGTLRRDAELLARVRFDYAILDESQAIKNAQSQSAKAARLLQADHRLALSGTPVENHLGELASLLEFLNPGLCGGARALQGLLAGKGDVESAHRLARALRPFFLRRTKESVLGDLPPKSEQVVVCELEGTERRAYDELREHYRRALLARADEQGLETMQMHVLEALLRLRQAACHPGLLDRSRGGEGSAKLDALLPRLEEVRETGHKALVFSQFTSLLAILRARLDLAGVAYEYLDGRTRKREDKVRRFQEDARCPLFLISLKAGGVGLNLTAADYVFLLDPWWNPAVERQAIDRAHRIGQTRPVLAYRMVARDTIEDKVLELQARKRALADALFAEKGTGLSDITRDDLEWLLS